MKKGVGNSGKRKKYFFAILFLAVLFVSFFIISNSENISLKNLNPFSKFSITGFSILDGGTGTNLNVTIEQNVSQKYEYYDTGYDASNPVSGDDWRAQSFTVGTTGTNENFTITSVNFAAYQENLGGTLTVSIKAVDGDGKPTGSALSSGTADTSTWGTSTSEWNQVTMTPYTLTAGTKYAIEASSTGGGMRWRMDASSPSYAGGNDLWSDNAGSSWTSDLAKDFLFEVWGTPSEKLSHLSTSDPNLILYMSFDENLSLTKIYDYTGNSNDGTISGTVDYNSSGKYGGAYDFGGSSDYIINSSAFSQQSFSTFSYSAWIKSDTSSIEDIYYVSTSTINFYIRAATGTRHIIRHAQLGDGTSDITTTENLADKNWHHIVFIWNGTFTHLYVDGNHYDGEAATGTFNLQGPFCIGNCYSPVSWDGLIDEAMLFNRSLSATEVAQIYNSTYSRFYPTGEMLFQNNNFGTNNTLNISIPGCQQLNGSVIKFKINDGEFTELDGSCAYDGYSMTGNLTSANLTLQLNSTPYNFYSPLIIGDIVLTSHSDADTSGPALSIEKSDTFVEYGIESININWSATDISDISFTILNVTYPNGSLLYSSNLNLSSTNLLPSNLDVIGNYSINLWANDSLGNNASTSNYFIVTIPWNVSTAIYDNINKTTTPPDNAVTGFCFKPDGTKLLALGIQNDLIYSYTLSTPWDLSTLSYDNRNFSISSQDGAMGGIWCNPEGTRIYAIGIANDRVFQYSMTDAWNASTLSYTNKNISTASQEGEGIGVIMLNNETEMWILGATSDMIHQFSLSTQADVSTASADNINYSIVSKGDSPQDMFLREDYSQLFLIEQSGDRVHQFSFSQPGNLSTIIDDHAYALVNQDDTPQAVFFNGTGDKMYVTGATNDLIYQYTLNLTDYTNPSVSITSPLNNSEISGIVTINATASDNEEVSGVQFFYCSANSTGEDIASEYNFPLEMSSNNRTLVDQDGKPFYMLGDTNWEIIAQMNETEIRDYLDDRQTKGFNTILTNMFLYFASTDGEENYEGEVPFIGGAYFVTPNDNYFTYLDFIVNETNERNMALILMAPFTGGGSSYWGSKINATSDANLVTWGEYLGNRYKDYDNIIWVVGGDMTPTDDGMLNKYSSIATGILNQDTNSLITVHAQRDVSSFDEYPSESWLNLETVYVTYDGDEPVQNYEAYNRTPTHPYFLIEGTYENAAGMTQQGLRAQAYWTSLQGGIGHIFGNCPLWSAGVDRSYCDAITWQTAVNQSGSKNMTYVEKLFNSREWYNLIPDQTHNVMTSGYGTLGNVNYSTGALTSDNKTYIAYLPTSRTFAIDLSKISGTNANVYWYNVRNGTATLNGTYATSTGTMNFVNPTSEDWVIVIDDASAGLSAPGTEYVSYEGTTCTNISVEDTSSPYSVEWNASTVSNGNYTLKARARDSSNNTANSSLITVVVNNVEPSLDCGTLSEAGRTYILTDNVSSTGTCFTISEENITLDCNDYWITYSTDGDDNNYGIYSNQFNVTIKNCNVFDGNKLSSDTHRYGIYLSSSTNNSILDNYVDVNNSNAIHVSGSTNNNFTGNIGNSVLGRGIYFSTSSNNTLTNNVGNSGSSYGLELESSSDYNILVNNTGISDSGRGLVVSSSYNNLTSNKGVSTSNYGIYLFHSSYNVLNSNNATGAYGYYIRGTNYTNISDCTYIQGSVRDVWVYSSEVSLENVFTNCSYDSETVEGASNYIIRKWYFDANVSYSNGTAIENANLTIYNSSSDSVYSALTDSNGDISRQELIDYVNTGGTRTYSTPHIVNVTKTGHTTNSTTYNLTSLNNVFGVIYLSESDTTSPTFTSIPANASLFYGNESLGVDFDAEDETSFGTFSVNDSTRFQINSTGYLSNKTILAVGVYELNISINDSSGNENSARYKVTINRASSAVSLNFDKTSPQTYGTSITPTCSVVSGTGSAVLRMNGTIISSGIAITLGADIYAFNCSLSESANYSYSENTSSFVINQASPSLSISITPSENVYFGNETTSTGSGCPAQLTCGLFRDGASVSNPDVQTLPIGTYVYVYNTSGNENYTSGTTTKNLNVLDPSAPMVTINSPLNQTYSVGTITFNVTATDETGMSACVYSLDGALNASMENSGDVWSAVNSSMTSGLHSVRYFCNDTDGNLNGVQLVYFTIDVVAPTYSLNQTNSTTAGQSTLFSLYADDGVSLHARGQYIFSTNNSGEWVNDSAVNFTETPSWANVTKILNSTGNTSVGYRWYLTDDAGNKNSTEIFVLMTEDITPPVITFVSPTAGATLTSASVTFSITTDENSTCNYSTNSFATNNSMTANSEGKSHSALSTLSNGNYVVNYSCADLFSNANNSGIAFSVSVSSGSTGGSPGGSSGGSTTTTESTNYKVEPTSINLDIGVGTTITQSVFITNNEKKIMKLNISEKNLGNHVVIPVDSFELSQGEKKEIRFVFSGLNDTGIFTGSIKIGSKLIPVALNVKQLNLLFDSNIVVLNNGYFIRSGDELETSVELIPMGDNARLDVVLNYEIKNYDGEVFLTRSESVLVEERTEFEMDFDTGILPPGKYIIGLELVYPNGVAPSSAHFEVIPKIPDTIIGKIAFYMVNGILILLIVIIGIVIKNMIPRIKKKSK